MLTTTLTSSLSVTDNALNADRTQRNYGKTVAHTHSKQRKPGSYATISQSCWQGPTEVEHWANSLRKIRWHTCCQQDARGSQQAWQLMAASVMINSLVQYIRESCIVAEAYGARHGEY